MTEDLLCGAGNQTNETCYKWCTSPTEQLVNVQSILVFMGSVAIELIFSVKTIISFVVMSIRLMWVIIFCPVILQPCIYSGIMKINGKVEESFPILSKNRHDGILFCTVVTLIFFIVDEFRCQCVGFLHSVLSPYHCVIFD